MGKKKNKDKDREKVKNDDKLGRKELAREVARLQAQNEALRARLERIAEIATAEPGPAPADSLVSMDGAQDQ